MFRGEKNTNWEGGFRVSSLIRWPGTIKPGTIYNDIFAHEDMLPTLLAAAGDPDIKEKLLAGTEVDGTKYKVHLDGYNMLPYLNSFIGRMMATSPRCVTATGKSCSLSSVRMASTCGRTRS